MRMFHRVIAAIRRDPYEAIRNTSIVAAAASMVAYFVILLTTFRWTLATTVMDLIGIGFLGVYCATTVVRNVRRRKMARKIRSR